MTTTDFILAQRFGFGTSKATVFDPLREISEGRSDRPAVERESILRLHRAYEAQKVVRESKGELREKARSAVADMNRIQAAHDIHLVVARAATSPDAFTARITAFWSNHFSLGGGSFVLRTVAGLYEPEALAPHVFGKFSDLLVAAEHHPAMVAYLNLQESIGPNSPVGKKNGRGLNENLGREIMELHSLGADGGYSQRDVISLSSIMTGWHIDLEAGRSVYLRDRAEPGAKHLLGKTFSGEEPQSSDYEDALRHLAAHPSTARFIGRKLARHFFGPASDAAAAALEAAYLESDGDLTEIYITMLSLPEARAPLGANARNDFEFVCSALRVATPYLRPGAFDSPSDGNGGFKRNILTHGSMAAMNQRLWLASSPKGWPDDPAYWLAPTILVKRLRWIPRLVRQLHGVDPLEFAKVAIGPIASKNTMAAVSSASNRLLGLGLVLASPEFNRR